MAKKSFAVKPLVFPDKTALRQWFAENHKTATEAHLGFYKKASGKKSATYHEAVTEALCFGWIDSIAHSIDDEIYTVRFTPRKAKSIWSKVNLKKIEELKSLGLMTPAGLAVYENRDPKKENLYSFEQESVVLPDSYLQEFMANTDAFNYFNNMSPSYKKAAIHWVNSAKQESTQLKRLRTLIEDSAAARKIKPLSY